MPGSSYILVIAPRFPSINQAWIDTYLQQLIKNGLSPVIYSTIKVPENYSGKVDELGLREHVLTFSLDIMPRLLGAAKAAIHLPWASLCRAWSLTKGLSTGSLSRLSGFIYTLHFDRSSRKWPKVQLIHSHSESAAFPFLYLSRLLNVPFVLTFHGLPPSGVSQLASEKRRLLYRGLAGVLVNTEYAKSQVIDLGCPPEKIRVLPQGLPISEFQFVSRSAPLPNEVLRLLVVGRYHRDKGQGYALLALRRLLGRGIRVECEFVGVGPDLARLKRLASRLSLASHVRFHIALPSDQLKNLYHSCHLFVLPSVDHMSGHVETQGVVLQEAQASGCIPVASRIGGIPECVEDSENALLFRQRSSRELAEAIAFLVLNPHVWPSYQSAGRRNVEDNYDADLIGLKMDEYLRALMQSGHVKG